MNAVFWLILLTFTPALELRASIPWGYFESGLSVPVVVAICIAANIALAPLVWLFLDKGIHIFLKVGWINDLYTKIIERARDRLHSYVDRWGTIGLALFIGVPLPGSGVYSGALGAYLLGFRFPQFVIASILGVCIAGAAVTAVVVSGSSAFELFIKH